MVHRGEIVEQAVRASGHKLRQLTLKMRGSVTAIHFSSCNLNYIRQLQKYTTFVP